MSVSHSSLFPSATFVHEPLTANGTPAIRLLGLAGAALSESAQVVGHGVGVAVRALDHLTVSFAAALLGDSGMVSAPIVMETLAGERRAKECKEAHEGEHESRGGRLHGGSSWSVRNRG